MKSVYIMIKNLITELKEFMIVLLDDLKKEFNRTCDKCGDKLYNDKLDTCQNCIDIINNGGRYE